MPARRAPLLTADLAARATEGDWRAAGWLLERVAPERWDRTARPPVPTLTPSAAFAGVDELTPRRREQGN